GAVDEAGRYEQPPQAVRVQDEGVVAAERVDALRLLLRLVVGRLVRLARVGVVATGPLARVRVPPDVALALRPRLAVGVGRRAVVEDSGVRGPRPAPLPGDPVVLSPRLLAGRLVDVVRIDAGVGPGPAARRAVVLQLLVLRDELAVGPAAVDLAQHRLRVRVVVRALG